MADHRFQEIPKLSSSDLILRAPKMGDVDLLFELRTDKEVNKYIRRNPMSKEEVEIFIADRLIDATNGKSLFWVIADKIDNTLGTICLWHFDEARNEAEIGYELHPKAQGKGIMTSAMVQVLAFAKEKLSLLRISAYTHFENESSIKLLKRFNFELNEELKDEDNEENRIYYLNLND